MFTQKLYSGQAGAAVVFDKAGLVLLGCNIHDQMVAWVVVVDTPYYGKSGADGKVALKNLPAGEYNLNAWYPALGFEPFTAKVTVEAAGAATVAVKLDASGLPR